ncbi:MAG: phytanoyl-CoA dioxygenase family protein [Candidatus Poribacteria bacterium]|jgi:hypothetical protein|nr:phytanoyl-CoA dioxygenase family protein [Candidatus Poribacteria bacterium]MDP6746888.1 phytanoyl-CoA dioxygenase family protein [Candidatus Poribacteria bacterium]MDP6998221.1 phytanoyl-CoA dioxygenase family protein [Candidatus Poribacteria bacterium]
MAEVQRRIDQKTLKPGRVAQLQEKDYFHNRHLDNRCIYELLNHPSLVEKAARILGGHLVWWRTNFQLKPPLAEQDDWDTEIPWHQDCAYYQPSPNIILLLGLKLMKRTVLTVVCVFCHEAIKDFILTSGCLGLNASVFLPIPQYLIPIRLLILN